jgi:hypothetical protein
MNLPSPPGLALVLFLLPLGLAPVAACGGSSSHGSGAPPASQDASTSYGADASTGDDAGTGFATDDGGSGNPFQVQSPDGGGMLQAHVQVNGNHGTCGACDVVLAQVTGGTQPYSYAWSDPSWQGPGPFMLCPTAGTSVSLTVTDSSESSGELHMAAQAAQASAQVDCVASDGGQGDGDAGPLHGCTAGIGSGTPDAGTNDAGQLECTQNEVEGGVAWADGGAVASVATALGYTFVAGHAYQVSYDRLLPIELGQPVTVEIYGSTLPDVCKADQLLFTLHLDGSIFNWHQAYCFTPDRDYSYAITNVYIQGVLTYINPLSVSTVCDSCTM